MIKILSTAFVVMALSAASASAAPCKDAKGKFTKCPAPAAVAKQVCKDAKGKFAKCGSPGAVPVPAKAK